MEFRIPFNGRPHQYTGAEIDAVVGIMRGSTPLTQDVYLREFENRFKKYVRLVMEQLLVHQL